MWESECVIVCVHVWRERLRKAQRDREREIERTPLVTPVCASYMCVRLSLTQLTASISFA